MEKKYVEILAPAGSKESARAAVCAGADAVYIGGARFGARAYADNPEEKELLDLIDYVHLHGRKIYMTVNTLLKQGELHELYEYLLPYYRQGIDAVIVQDIGAMRHIRERFPELPIHVSTQATVTNALGAKFYGSLGAERIVPARELSIAEIKDMKERAGLEIECFVHGAMCYCYSGQCLLSSMIGGRSGNRGQCAQPCRLPYRVNGGKPQDILSLKDMCTIDFLPELLEAGIDSFKIEGRMKKPEYVYTTAAMYRKYADLYMREGREGYRVSEEDRKILMNAYQRRGYSDGYYRRHNGREMIAFGKPSGGKEENIEKNDRKEYKIKEKINGNLILSEGKHAKLNMEYHGRGRACCVEVLGDTVQEAVSAPLDEERIGKQIRKTGNTEFEFENLEVHLKGKVFLPVQSLNEMRREGLEALERAIISRHHRREPAAPVLPEEKAQESEEISGKSIRKIGFQVSVQTKEQLAVISRMIKNIPQSIDIVYVEGSIAFDENIAENVSELQKARTSVFVSMPYIFRQSGMDYYETVFERLVADYDGVLIRNWESYAWLLEKRFEKFIISDYNLYVFNQESRNFIRRTRIRDYTSSPELNMRELKAFCGGGILPVYGHQPVMITAGCIKKTAEGCRREEGITWLTDRYQKKFPVRNYCADCYNVMYNCTPLMLADMKEEIEKLMPSAIRLDFAIENESRVREMIRLFGDTFFRGEKAGLPDMEYTRGHFKRGVK